VIECRRADLFAASVCRISFKKWRSGERNACGIILAVFHFGLVGMISCGSNRGWGARMMAAVVAVVPPQAAGGVAAVVPMKEASFAPSKVQSQLVLMRHGNYQRTNLQCSTIVLVLLLLLFSASSFSLAFFGVQPASPMSPSSWKKTLFELGLTIRCSKAYASL
jgi:hypothetical protein